jgi:Bacterial pre-peptidase C-terminal domain
MLGPVKLSTPRACACRWRRMTGGLAVLAMVVVVGGLSPSLAQAQKNINFTTTGSVRSTLVFTNQISPDVYSFFATAGEQIRVQTSNNSFDTTIRVIGPDAAINLFDDDGGSVASSPLASRLVFTAADTGTYIVVVSSFSGNPGGGDYTLNFARGAAASSSLQALTVDTQGGESVSDVDNAVEEKPLK